MPWDLFYIRLAVALDLDERDRYYRYVLASGDPKKFPWSSEDKAGLRDSGPNLVQRTLSRFKGQFKHGRIDDIVQPGERRILQKIAHNPDGSKTIVGYVWKDTGEELTPEELQNQGRIFMRSHRQQGGGQA